MSFTDKNKITRKQAASGVKKGKLEVSGDQAFDKDSGEVFEVQDNTEDNPDLYRLPSGCTYANIKKCLNEFGFIEHANRYYKRKAVYDGEGEEKALMYYTFEPISNFVIVPLFLVMSREGGHTLAEIRNTKGRKRVIEFEPKHFIQVNQMREQVEGFGNFFFEGSNNEFRRIVMKIYEDRKEATLIETLGFDRSTKHYFFANGLLSGGGFLKSDDYGIVELEGNHYFIPALSSLWAEDATKYEDEKRFIYRTSEVKMKDWFQLFDKVHGDRGKIAFLYYLTSLFRDIAYKLEQNFPLLFLFGNKGSGKSSLAWSLTYLFSKGITPFMLNAGTNVGFHNRLARFSNSIAWFDEYRNDIDGERIQKLKAAYDGVGHERRDMSNKGGIYSNSQIPVNSACVVSGQEKPVQDIALYTRCICLMFAPFKNTPEVKENFDKLSQMQEQCLSDITANFLSQRPKMEREYYAKYQEVVTEHNKGKSVEVIDRLFRNVAKLLATFKVFQTELEELMGIKYEAFREMCMEAITIQNNDISQSEEAGEFWSMVGYLAASKIIVDGEDYMVRSEKRITKKNGGALDFIEPKKVLYIRLQKVHQCYLEHSRKGSGKNGLDKNSLIHYLKYSEMFLGYCKKHFPTSNNSISAYAFDYELLEKIGFELPNVEEHSSNNTTPPPPPAEQIPI